MEMSDAARELELYIDNDGDLDRRTASSIRKNLATKAAKGVYQHDIAVKAFEHLAEAGAKKYAEEFGGVWNRVFSPADRRACAASLTAYFEAELRLGNYDHLVPTSAWGRSPGPRTLKSGGGARGRAVASPKRKAVRR